MKRFATVLLCILPACVGPVPADLPTDHDWMVVVNTVRLPDSMDWYTRFAEHSWIDLKQGSEDDWTRIEISGTTSGVVIKSIKASRAREPIRWDNPAFVLEVYVGEEARELIPGILQSARSVPDYGRLYDAWPGPNSNTLIAQIIDRTPGLHAELHHNAVGKDYPNGFRAGFTSSGYGVEADAGLLGVGLGLRQGVELHLFGLTAGVSLWPPALKIPLLPRLGVHQGWVGSWR